MQIWSVKMTGEWIKKQQQNPTKPFSLIIPQIFYSDLKSTEHFHCIISTKSLGVCSNF